MLSEFKQNQNTEYHKFHDFFILESGWRETERLKEACITLLKIFYDLFVSRNPISKSENREICDTRAFF